MGNLRAEKKLDMLQRPVINLESSPVDVKYLSTLRVFFLATSEEITDDAAAAVTSVVNDNRNYMIIGAVRSPAFAFGSARSLRGRSKRGVAGKTVLDDMYWKILNPRMNDMRTGNMMYAQDS